MQKRVDNFAQSVRRHGLWRTCLRYAYTQLNRVLTFDIYRVESGITENPGWPTPEGYSFRAVDEEEFSNNLCQEFKSHDMHWAFKRGDLCFVALFDGEIVAYYFVSNHAAVFRDDLIFKFPDGFRTALVSTTASSHRGRGIARELWTLANQTLAARGSVGAAKPNIWTVSIFNLESLAANRGTGTQYVFHGYAGYLRLFGSWFTFASPRCRALGAGFRQAEA